MSKNRLIKFWGILMIAFMLAFQSGGSASTAQAATIRVSIYGMLDYDAASQILSMVNAERASYGLSPMVTNSAIQEYAMLRAQELAITYEHTRPNGTRGLDGIPDKGSWYGENIAYGYASAEAVMTAWMNSSGHRANILDSRNNQIGIGCYYTNRTWYWAQCFNARTTSSPVRSGTEYRTTRIETVPTLLNLVMAGSAGEVKEGAELSLHIMHENPHTSSGKVELLSSNFSWSSLNSSAATVTDTGVITGISAGQAEITATLNGFGSISGTIPIVHDPGSAATCTDAQTCRVCKAVLNPALGHSPGREATCTTDQKCTRCGVVLNAKLGHAAGDAATCTTDQKCKRCGATLEKASGHQPGEAATCTTDQKCKRCGTILVPKLGHYYVNTTVKPTKTQRGYTLHKCQRCSYSYKSDYVPATGSSSSETSSSSGSSETSPSGGSSSSAKGGTKKSTTSSVTIKWKSDSRATAGYAVAVKSGGQYVIVDFLKKGTTTYTLKKTGTKKLKAGTTYTVWIIPVQKISGRTVLITSDNNIFKTSTAPKTVTLSSVVRKSQTNAVLKWKKVSGVSGYQIQMSTNPKSGFRKIKTLSSGKKTYTRTGLSKKKTYYFRIRAYKKVTGGYVYGAWSKVKKMK